MEKIENKNNKKVHYLNEEADIMTTLCGMNENGIVGYKKPIWLKTEKEVNCKLCLKKIKQLL